MFTQGPIFGFTGGDSNYFLPSLVLNQVHSHYSQLAYLTSFFFFFFLASCIRHQNLLLREWALASFGPRSLKFQSPSRAPKAGVLSQAHQELPWLQVPCLGHRDRPLLATEEGGGSRWHLCPVSFLFWRVMTQVSDAGAVPSPTDVIRPRHLESWFGHPIPLGFVLTKQPSAKSWVWPNAQFPFWEGLFFL